MASKTGLATPHTTHCLADGHIMISAMGDAHHPGEGKGNRNSVQACNFSADQLISSFF